MDFSHRPLTKEEEWVTCYEGFVDSLTEGYSLSIYEYVNDLHCRKTLEENRNHPAIRSQWSRVQKADALLQSILLPTKHCLHGNYPKEYFWYWGYPPNSPELEADLREVGDK